MRETKLIKLKFSERSNKDELDYRNKIQPNEEDYDSFDKWVIRINDGRLKYFEKVNEKINFSGVILELGAGSCWFGGVLSKLSKVKKVYSLDFSEKILRDIAPKIINYLDADKDKIIRVVGDFYNLNFKEKFDFVVIDAALHHIDDMDFVLKQIKDVLKDEGLVVGIREPIVPILRPGCRKTFGVHERSLGLTENIFSKKEWNDFFVRNGFILKFVSVIPEYRFKHKLINRSPLKWLNGWLFAHYVLVAEKDLK